MATIKKYNGSSWENAVVRKFGTTTEAVENPLYSDGTAITAYTLKGNEEHTGTPTPSNPVEVNGVGVRTENLLPTTTAWYLNNNSSALDKSDVSDIRIKTDIFPVSDTNAFVTVGAFNLPNVDGLSLIGFRFYGDDLTTALSATGSGNTRAIPTGAKWLSLLYGTNSTTFDTSTIKTAMQAAQITVIYGQTAPSSYIPYGYKIPISSGGVTTNIYLTEQLMKIGDTADSLVPTGTVNRVLYRYEFTGNETWIEDTRMVYLSKNYLGDIPAPLANSALICSHFPNNNVNGMVNGGAWVFQTYGYTAVASDLSTWKQWLADQYAAGTPVTVYYVLETPTTETVTAPSIPTTEGANSITVDTTVQPSEFTATWTGWHDASVKEWDGSIWG